MIQSIQYGVLKNNMVYKNRNKLFRAGEVIIIEAVVKNVLNQKVKMQIVNPFGISIFQSETAPSKSNVGKIVIKLPTNDAFFAGKYTVMFTFHNSKKEDFFILENQLSTVKRIAMENYFYITNNYQFPVFDVKMDFILPKHIQGLQEIEKIRIYGDYQKRITDFEDNMWVRATVKILKHKENVRVGYYAIIRLKQNVLPISEPLRVESTKATQKYLESEHHIESEHPEIKKVCHKVDSISKSIREFIINAQRWIHNNIKYKALSEEKGAKFAIEKRYGDCTEFSALLVALCRCKGIPSRLVGGYGYSATKKTWEPHAWAECFLNGQWFAVEPTWKTHLGIIGYTPDRITTIYGNWMVNRVTKDFIITYKIKKTSSTPMKRILNVSNKINISLVPK